MSNVRWDLANIARLGTARVIISTATTTNFDFTINSGQGAINLITASAAATGYMPGDRILVVLSATTTGTTDSITWVLQDAPDNGSGAIGTTATAVTSVVAGALASGTSNSYAAFAVQIQPNRPWLRFRVTSSGATDTFHTHCTVYAIPNNA